MKLLIVDDNERIRTMIRRSLVSGLHEVDAVLECGDGADAIRLYNLHHPDWVLMDIQLRHVDGLQATRQITAGDPGAKVIIITQFDDQVYREEARSCGAVSYVLKENMGSLPHIIRNHPDLREEQ